nr:PREDICTED: heat shock 70 kDa protein 14-like [Bemisia tabaci]
MSRFTVFGIYVGNTSASIAICKEDGKVEVLANAAGERSTPAVVAVTEKEQIVGNAAKSSMITQTNAGTIITNNKLLMDLSLDESDLESIIAKNPCTIIQKSNHVAYEINFGNKTKTFTPAMINTSIYSLLYNIAKSAIHGECDEICCVLVVPTYYSAESRQYIKQSAVEAGWKVLQIVNQPSVAPLAYHSFKEASPETKYICVYRVGGVSCDAAILRLRNGFIQILASETNFDIGGHELVSKLIQCFCEEMKRKYKVDPNESKRSIRKLRSAAETCIKVLSTLSSASVSVDSLFEGIDFNYQMSRARFESLIPSLFGPLDAPINDALQSAQLQATDINEVILCGEPLKTPRLQSHVKSLFPNAEVLSSINPDEVLARGAARQAGFITEFCDLHKSIPEPVTDVTFITEPITVQIQSSNNEEIVFEKFSSLPISKTVHLKDNKSEIIVTAAQSCSAESKLNGKVTIPSSKDSSDLYLDVEINAEQAIEIHLLNKEMEELQMYTMDLVAVPAS